MISRRSLLAVAASSFAPTFLRAAARGSLIASAFFRYEDLATELPVLRLTDPNSTAILPAAAALPVARKGGFLLYASDLSGRFEGYRMDLKKGESRQLTEAADLDPQSLVMVPGEAGFCYFDGGRLMSQLFTGARTTQWLKASEGFELVPSAAVSVDGLFSAVIEKKAAVHRLRLVNVRLGTSTTLAEDDEPMLEPSVRPKRASVLYRRGGSLYLANFDGKQNYRLKTLDGSVAQAQWSPDGRSLLYLHVPSEAGKLRSIREFTPDTNEDRAVADTTQFAAFARNADASVFVGASISKASPYVLLLARAVKRELTLCEHRASNPAMVHPQFSPNSQQVFFSSDLHGKPAIYRMDVEKLVSDTAQTEALYK